MNSSESDRRVIIATVGEQPGAVLAPLMTRSLRPSSGDTVLLIASERSRLDGVRIRKFLNRKLRFSVKTPLIAGPRDLTPEIVQAISRVSTGATVSFLVNSGPFPWTRQALDVVVSQTDRLELIQSRDPWGHRFRLKEEGWVREPFDVEDLGRKDLLKFLELDLDEECGVLRRGEQTLEGIVSLRERAGMLFAAVDVDRWIGDRQDLLDRFRQVTQVDSWLHSLGLDRRRLFLVGSNQGLLRRASRRGILVRSSRIDLHTWESAVGKGTAQSLHSDLKASLSVPPRANGSGEWTGTPLVVIMGPLPGSTLQAIWSHKPQDLILLYDDREPRSTANVHSLMAVEGFQVRRIEAVPIDQIWGRETPVGSRWEMNLTPGDKWSTFNLLLWGRSQEPSLTDCSLMGGEILSSNGVARPGGFPPLKCWIEIHCHDKADLGRVPSESIVGKAAHAIVESLAGTKDLGSLTILQNRSSPPRIAQRMLYAAANVTVPISDLPLSVAETVEQPGRGGSGERRRGVRSGVWFEWVVGRVIQDAGIDQTYWSVRIGTYLNKEGKERWSDELDIVTQTRTQIAYWSCKTGRSRIDERLATARAQADHVLGGGRPAILVVPRLPTERPSSLQAVAEGHWSDMRGMNHVVDCSFLSRHRAILDLASKDPRAG